MERKTPFYDRHVAAGGKIVPFANYLLPVQYSDISKEHMAVRESAGLFDVSHMGELIIEGADALLNLNRIFTNDFTNMKDGRVRYSPLCNENGGIVDDMIIYRFSENKYMAVPNAANRQKVYDFILPRIKGDAKLTDVSDAFAQIALQGPRSKEILLKPCDLSQIPDKYYTFIDNVNVGGVICLVSRTGYTGELGYELYCAPEDAERLWDSIRNAGENFGLIPCGLGARDTLRLEASMPLYGHEMNDEISPLETGLDFAVKMGKDDFVGKSAIEKRGEPKIIRVGIKVTGRGIIRENCPIFVGDKQIGISTSGTHLPYLNGAYAMALVDKEYSTPKTVVEAEVRGRKVAAEIVPLPFYKA
jgi:aminomethyltransferase